MRLERHVTDWWDVNIMHSTRQRAVPFYLQGEEVGPKMTMNSFRSCLVYCQGNIARHYKVVMHANKLCAALANFEYGLQFTHSGGSRTVLKRHKDGFKADKLHLLKTVAARYCMYTYRWSWSLLFPREKKQTKHPF